MHTLTHRLIYLAATIGSAGIMQLAFAAPSSNDRIVSAKPPPDYPEQERRAHHTGNGVFRAYLDKATGTVTSVKIEKTTGFPALDAAAMKAIVQWRFQRGFAESGPIPLDFRSGGR